MGVKDVLKPRLKKARLVGGIVKDSVVFNLKKQTVRKAFRLKPIDCIVVDMDGTLFSSDASLEALKLMYPENVGGKIFGDMIFDVIMENIASGHNSIEGAIVWGNNFLVNRGFERKHLGQVLEIVKPFIRVELVEALKMLKQNFGVRIVLATQSSYEFGKSLGKYLRKEYGLRFDLVIGTKLKFDSSEKLVDVVEIVAMKSGEFEGIPVKTKAEILEDYAVRKNWDFDFKKCLLITDGYSDMDLAKRMRTVLIKVSERRINQTISQVLRLADYIVEEFSYLGEAVKEIVVFSRKYIK